ncbi:unnamed protein product [Prunus brigantina]
MICRATNHHVNPIMSDYLRTSAGTCTTPVSSPQFGSSPRSNLRTSRKKVIPVLVHQHSCKLA